ncbi:MAG: formylglycine-generating enzyme family protein [Chloroflexi bacterium]|nr:formylglycine-generating enzyme family protein [Chloroflexota bacterium]MBU1746114.1 formylglycine-generating enzyme family protein [Chloroflexota bacterium]
MGSDKARDPKARNEELPQHQVKLPRYWIGKTPVTVAQFRAFVQASGYQWAHAAPQGGEDHPVAHLNWHDAQAYCGWLSGVWRATGQIDANEVVRLPSEAEWEKAARGVDGRVYPWGDEPPDAWRCNIDYSVRDTTPVGAYSPQGDSPYGCVDMAGNIYEWTRSLWGKDYNPEFKYPYNPDDGREDPGAGDDVRRVYRGSGWDSDARYVRTAYRNGYLPNRPDFGFRVVVVSSVSP